MSSVGRGDEISDEDLAAWVNTAEDNQGSKVKGEGIVSGREGITFLVLILFLHQPLRHQFQVLEVRDQLHPSPLR